MDSVTVLLNNIGSKSDNGIAAFFQFIISIAPLVVAILVPFFTLRHTRKLKELELGNAQKDRKFQLERTISEKALEVMGQSYHYVHTINGSLNFYHNVNEEGKQELVKRVREARIYWEKNLFYLPQSIRKHIIPLTNFAFASFGHQVHDRIQDEAFDKISTMFREIEVAFAKLMEEYNLFDKLGDTPDQADSTS